MRIIIYQLFIFFTLNDFVHQKFGELNDRYKRNQYHEQEVDLQKYEPFCLGTYFRGRFVLCQGNFRSSFPEPDGKGEDHRDQPRGKGQSVDQAGSARPFRAAAAPVPQPSGRAAGGSPSASAASAQAPQ